jgi:pyruvate dehydrogenase E1 component beta subunit
LALYELSAFHDAGELFTHALASGVPSIIFENKLLYGRRMHRLGTVDRLFRSDTMIEGTTQVGLAGAHAPDVIFVAPGFTAELALQAARTLLTLHEVTSRILVPSRLYPVPVESLLAGAAGARHILVVEEGTAGGTWGAEVAHRIHTAMWGSLAGPVRLVHGRDAIIPAAPHLEKEVLVSDESIVSAALEALRHG